MLSCQDVSDKQLVTAYREAAKKMHPDRGGDKESFQRLQAAYSQIVNARKAAGGFNPDGPGGGKEDKGHGSRGRGTAKEASAGGKDAPKKAEEADREAEADGGVKAGLDDPAKPQQDDGEGKHKKRLTKEKQEAAVRKAEEAGAASEAEAMAEGKSAEDAIRIGAAAAAAHKAAADAGKGEEAAGAAARAASEALSEGLTLLDAQLLGAAAAEEAEPFGSNKDDDEDATPVTTEEAASSDGTTDGPTDDPLGDSAALLGGAHSAAAAAAAAEAAGAEAAVADITAGGEEMSAEEMCCAAEAAAEAARACAASARIGRRVAALGGGGWEVLCDCAQCVLRCSQNAAVKAAAVGAAAMESPSKSGAALDAASGRKLGRRAERELRSLTEALMVAVRQARCAVLAASVCASKSSDAAGLVASLAHLPPAHDAMRSVAGSASLSSLMIRVAEVLADMSAAVGEAAEHAMSTAVAVAEMERQAEVVKQLAAQAAEVGSDDEEPAPKSKEEIEAEAAAKAAAKEEARAREEAEGGPNLSASAKRRVENARWLRKVSAELSESQTQIIRLVSQTPQLLPPVSIPKKEQVFEQLTSLLATALRPIERDWYEGRHQCGNSRGAGRTVGGSEEDEERGGGRLQAWATFAREHLEFVFHAAEPHRLPVPSSRSARLLRLAAFVDIELTVGLLRTQLLHKVLLFVPDLSAADPLCHSAVVELKLGLEGCIKKLTEHCAPSVAAPGSA